MKKYNHLFTPIVYLLSFSLLIAILIFFHFRGTIYNDEGYILNSALRIAQGQIPYRDFDMVYTPISFLTTAAFLKIFGVSIFTGRLAALTISIASMFALYKLLIIITKNKLLIFLCLLFFIAWGPAHINFPWPVMFSICFLFYTALFYLQGIILKKQNYFYFAGIMTMICFLAKHNFGTAILLILLPSFLFLNIKNAKKYFLNYLLGIISISLITILLLISTSSFSQFIDNIYIYTIKRIIFDKSLDTPFIYEGSFISKYTKLIFYLIPLLISFIAFYVSKKSKNKIYIIGLLTALFYIIGIRPTTDYVHLVPLIAVSGICLVIIIQYIKNKFISLAFLLILIFLTLFGFYTAYFSGYYKWEAPLKIQNNFVSHPRINVFLDQNKAALSEELIAYIDKHTKPDEYIFINYYEPLIYFISDRKNATRYDLTFDLPPAYQKIAIQELQDKKVKLIIIPAKAKNEKSILADYIRKQYHTTQHIKNYLIYTK